MSDLSVRQITRLLKKISLHDGDIVVVKQSKFNEKDILEMLGKGVERLGLQSVFVIMVEDDMDIETLNRQEMKNHGWYHISEINKLTDRAKR